MLQWNCVTRISLAIKTHGYAIIIDSNINTMHQSCGGMSSMCGACLGWGESELETLQHIYLEPQMCASALVGITSFIKSSCPFGLCVALVVVRARRTSTITHNGP